MFEFKNISDYLNVHGWVKGDFIDEGELIFKDEEAKSLFKRMTDTTKTLGNFSQDTIKSLFKEILMEDLYEPPVRRTCNSASYILKMPYTLSFPAKKETLVLFDHVFVPKMRSSIYAAVTALQNLYDVYSLASIVNVSYVQKGTLFALSFYNFSEEDIILEAGTEVAELQLLSNPAETSHLMGDLFYTYDKGYIPLEMPNFIKTKLPLYSRETYTLQSFSEMEIRLGVALRIPRQSSFWIEATSLPSTIVQLEGVSFNGPDYYQDKPTAELTIRLYNDSYMPYTISEGQQIALLYMFDVFFDDSKPLETLPLTEFGPIITEEDLKDPVLVDDEISVEGTAVINVDLPQEVIDAEMDLQGAATLVNDTFKDLLSSLTLQTYKELASSLQIEETEDLISQGSLTQPQESFLPSEGRIILGDQQDLDSSAEVSQSETSNNEGEEHLASQGTLIQGFSADMSSAVSVAAEVEVDFNSQGSVSPMEELDSQGTLENTKDLDSQGTIEGTQDLPSQGTLESIQDLESQGTFQEASSEPIIGVEHDTPTVEQQDGGVTNG